MTQAVNAGKSYTETVVERSGPFYQAYQILRFVFTVAPIIAGLDKFANLLVRWDQYLSPIVTKSLGWPAHPFMVVVGIIEIIAGLIVAFKPRVGSIIVAIWLAAIIINLLTIPAYFDIALRDFGLLLSAVALARLSSVYDVSRRR